ncbi:MAG: hypothetical protein ACNA8K_10705 [Cyclonatronaceae bacterium]
MEETQEKPLQRSIRIMIATILVFGILVATHLGEFWPFSIFPMFSQAGNPWTRSMAMDVTGYTNDDVWTLTVVDDLPGEHFSMRAHGVDQIDYSNFVSKTRDWNPVRVQALRNMLGENILENRRLMIYKVRGELINSDSVAIEATPMLLLEPDTTLFNPNLPPSFYFRD